jgi:hypothetical protein
MCMTLSGHTSTLPRLVVQGRVFEGSWLQSGFGQKSHYFCTIMTEGVILRFGIRCDLPGGAGSFYKVHVP